MRRIRNLANPPWYLGLILLISLLAVACGGGATPTTAALPIAPTATAAPTATVAPATAAAATPTLVPAATAAPTATIAATEAPTQEVMMPQVASVGAVQNPDLGVTMLADADGVTFYLFTEDELGQSNCSGQCADFWPPLLTEGAPTAGEGVSAEQLGTIEREDGSVQVTYNGWPLYYFSNDAGPGETNGQDVGDVWYVVSTFGGPSRPPPWWRPRTIQTAALVETSDHA